MMRIGLRLALLGMVFILGCNKSEPAPAPTVSGPPARVPAVQVALDFGKYEMGKTPGDFATALTGGGSPESWVVQEDGAGRAVLTQTSVDGTEYRFPVCIYMGAWAKDGEVTVRFKTVSGRTDQAGGLVVRYRDKDNYYALRANALENNVRLYKVESGRRRQIAGADTKVTSGEWHSLGLVTAGGHFRASFEGKLVFEADDTTIKEAGRVGLWTKSDSVTSFDALKIVVLESE